LDFIPDIPAAARKPSPADLLIQAPFNFAVYGVSPYFLVNFGQTLSTLFILGMLVLICKILEHFKNKLPGSEHVMKLVTFIKWNYLLTFGMTIYIPLLVSILIQYQNNQTASSYQLASMIFSILCSVLMLFPLSTGYVSKIMLPKYLLTMQNKKEEPATPYTTVKIDIDKSPTVALLAEANSAPSTYKENNNEKQTNEKQNLIPKKLELKVPEEIKAPAKLLYPAEYETLFKSVQTGAPIHAMYFTVSMTRSFFVVLFLVTLVAYPLAQTIIILIINLQFFGYLLKYRSFKFRYLFAQEVGNELSLLLAYLFMLILAIYDNSDTPLGTIDVRNTVGFGMIIINSMTFVWNVGFQLYDVYLILKELFATVKSAWHDYKQKKAAALQQPLPLENAKAKPEDSPALKEEKETVGQENVEPLAMEEAPRNKSYPMSQNTLQDISFENAVIDLHVTEDFKAFEAFRRGLH
jgi:hypothetical protein